MLNLKRLFSSKDTIINIWHVRDPSPDEPTPNADPPTSFTHLINTKQGDLTSLDWSPDGTLLAAGSYDTYLRVCDSAGQLYFAESMQKVFILELLTLTRVLNMLVEKGPVFATRFSPSGQHLLTASIDGSVCVWDISKKALSKQYHCHESESNAIRPIGLFLIICQAVALM